MKKILLLALLSTFAMSGFTSGTTFKSLKAEGEDKRLCKVFIKKAHKYKETMRDDAQAKATLESYKERVVSYCGIVASSEKTRSFLAQGDDKVLCKTSIREAHEYKATMNKSKSNKDIFKAHKEKIVSHCGKLVSKS